MPRQIAFDWIALALVLAASAVGPWLFGGARFAASASLLFLTFLAGVLFGLRPLLFRMSGHPVFPPALAVFLPFLIFAACNVPHAAASHDAMLDTIRCAGLVIAFWIWADVTSGHHGRWRWLFGILLMSASLMCLYALIQHARGSSFVLSLPRPAQYEMRASGAFICPNHFASFIALLLPLALALLACRDSGYPLRIFAFYSMLTIAPALYLTQSRSGWLGALAGLIVTWILLSARKGWRSLLITALAAPLAAAAIAFAAWTFSPMVHARIENAMQGNERVQLWKDTLRMIGDAPMLGHGPGNFRWAYPSYWRDLKMFTDPEHPHNEPLEAVADYGAVGTALLVLGLAVAAGTFLLRLRSSDRDRDTALVAAALGAGTAALVHGCFDYNLHIFSVASTVVMIAGIAMSGLSASGSASRSEWCGPKIRRAAGLFAAIVSAGLALLIAQAVASNFFSRTGDEARARLDYARSESAYKTAIALDPRDPQPFVGLGHLLRIRATWSLDAAQKNSDADKAEQMYRAALARNSAQMDAEESIALVQKLRGDDERALETLRAVVAKAPMQRDNLCRLGIQLRQMGRTAEALEIFRRAREMGETEMIEINLRELEKLTAPKK